MNPKTKMLVVLLLTFLLGCVVGASLLSGTWRSLTRSSHERESYRTYMYNRLMLDSAQIGRVDSLLDAYKSSINQFRHSVQSSRDSLRTEIKALLTTEQIAEYEEILAEMNKRDYYKRSDTLHTK